MWLNYLDGSDTGLFTFQVTQRTEDQTLTEAADESWQNALGRIRNLERLSMEQADLGDTPAIQFLAAFKGPEQCGLVLTITALSETDCLVGSATVYSSDPRRLLAMGEAAEGIARSIRLPDPA